MRDLRFRVEGLGLSVPKVYASGLRMVEPGPSRDGLGYGLGLPRAISSGLGFLMSRVSGLGKFRVYCLGCN